MCSYSHKREVCDCSVFFSSIHNNMLKTQNLFLIPQNKGLVRSGNPNMSRDTL